MPQDDTFFRSLFDFAAVGMAVTDSQSRILHCNFAFAAMLGYRREELAGLPMAAVLSPEEASRLPSDLAPRDKAPIQSEWRLLRKDGSEFAAEFLLRKTPDGRIHAIVRDISERAAAEAARAVKDRRERYLLHLEARLREAKTSRDMVCAACEAIGRELGAAFAGVGEFQDDGEATLVHSAWSAAGALANIVGRHTHFPAKRLAALLSSGPLCVTDAQTDPRIAGDAGAQAAAAWIGARSGILAPLMRNGKPRANLTIGCENPRTWSEEEIGLACETIDRVWQAVERARAEDELRLATERFEVALKDSPIIVVSQDADLRHTWAYNTRICPSLLIGKTEAEFFQRAEDVAASQAIKRRAMLTGQRQRVELPLWIAGAEFVFDLLAVPLRDSAGQVAGVTCAMVDITARKQAEAALRESEERLRFCLKGAGAAAWQWFAGGEQIWSPECFALHGLNPQRGQPSFQDWLDCIHPGDRARVEGVISDTVANRKSEYQTEYRVAHPSGDVRWLAALGEVAYAADGSPLRVSGLSLDITGRKRAEEALRESEGLLRLSMKSAGAAAWRWDIPAGAFIGSTDSYRLYGCETWAAATRSYDDWRRRLHPEDRARAERMATEVFAQHSPKYKDEYRVVFPSGEVRWLDVQANVEYADGGAPLRVSGISLDITERKRAEEALRESEELLRLSMRGAGATPWRWNINTGEMIGSQESYRRFGRDPNPSKPYTYQDWLDCLHPEDRASTARGVAEALEKQVAEHETEYRVVLASGEVRWLSSLGKVEYAGDGSPLRMWGITLDITERKRTEDALRETEDLLRLAMKSAGAAAWSWDIQQDRMIGSPENYALYGLDPEMGPLRYADWLERVHPEDRSRMETAYLVGLKKPSPYYNAEYRIVRPSGEIRWIAAAAKADIAAEGAPGRLSGINLDITERKRADEALRESEERLRFCLKAARAGAWQVDIPSRRIIWSPESCEAHGRDPKLGSPTYDEFLRYIHPGDRTGIHDELLDALIKRTPEFKVEYRVVFPGGELRWLASIGKVEYAEDGSALRLSGIHVDITGRKRAEEALRESEARLRFSLDAANAGTGEYTPETGEIYASDRARVLLGVTAEPISVESALSALHPEDRRRVLDAFKHTLETGEPYRLESRVCLADGSFRWVQSFGERRSVAGKQAVGGLVQDITERKRAEIALRESEELLRAIIEHAPVPVILSREDRKILLVNPALTALTGYSHSDIPTRDEWEAYAYRENAPSIRRQVAEMFETDQPRDSGELWIHTKAGEKRLWAIKTAPAGRDPAGKRLAVSVALDITERHNSAGEARRTSAMLEAALAAMADAVLISDTKGRFTHYNTAFSSFYRLEAKGERLYSLEDRDTAGDLFLPGGDYVPPREWPCPKALRGETAANVEYLVRRPDGETYCSSNFAPIRDASGEIIGAVVTTRDITEQKRAETRLRESEARLSSIIDTAADAIIVVDGNGVIQSANRSTAAIFGYSPEELAGRHASLLLAPQMRDGLGRFLATLRERGGGIWEMDALRKNGETVPLNVAVAKWKDGEGRRFFTGILRDLSERKRSEEALASARRLETVGQLAGGVAHDFNNLLSVIAGNLDLALDRIDDETARLLLRRALDAAEKGAGLNRRLLSLARRRAERLERLDLNASVEETSKLLRSAVGERIAIALELAAGLWTARADPGEVDSAILNLAANARDALPDGGTITIATSNLTLDAAAAARLSAEAKPGDYVCLSIADNGVGMQKDVLERAMEPFFTTKGAGAGTGLGLTTVASFARQSGGIATISSEPGKGCVVRICLPRSIEEEDGQAAGRDIPLGDGELVLVVEDDDQVREMTLKRIEGLGYSVAEARTGPEALALLTSDAPVQAVLSDVVMPGGMSGYDLVQWVASNKPDVQVITCSGYSEGERRGDASALADPRFELGKPYTREQLACALRNALSAKRLR
jgi:two-component system, cell cycle sensor histidine kinase and response regulator CckA